jgi:hypothetical protein
MSDRCHPAQLSSLRLLRSLANNINAERVPMLQPLQPTLSQSQVAVLCSARR